MNRYRMRGRFFVGCALIFIQLVNGALDCREKFWHPEFLFSCEGKTGRW
jgi:hypothetical protein